MWIPRERYDVLIRAEAAADYLRLRVNELSEECGVLRFSLTGQPQRVTQIAKVAPAPRTGSQIGNKPFTPPNQFTDPSGGTVDFEDMGDASARAEGIEVDDEGRVKL